MKVFEFTSEGKKGPLLAIVFGVQSIALPLKTEKGFVAPSPGLFGKDSEAIVTSEVYSNPNTDIPMQSVVDVLNKSSTGAICFCTGLSPMERWHWVIVAKEGWVIPAGFTFHAA
jgi:hypothetical protein